MNLQDDKKTEFESVRIKANKHGFQIEKFSGFTLFDYGTSFALHFHNLDDLNAYIDAADLSECEMNKHYNFPVDADLAE